ncbi:MAG TPA: CRISPR system precrRNA processing endoribonuclease RAMP protein Cas6 [Bryobacteraceae bacterium]|nr:CRISPR system precrRNA processing endoribonuclease RAMP protein Cas6 [Bryobacteraceae bacterium]
MTFDLYSYRFVLQARDAISFPRFGPANLLRGAFGSALRKVACVPQCPGLSGGRASECALQSTCAYARIFEPAGLRGPSGLADPPRPFVLRVAHLAGRSVTPGEQFCFNVNFFDTRRPALDEFARAFTELARADLISTACEPVAIPLGSDGSGASRLRLEFRTPTELKTTADGNTLATTPEFAVLLGRARDRVSTLRALYGAGPLDVDFRAMGQRARSIKMTRCELNRAGGQRRSRRTGQVHGIGGFTGVAEYEGDLAEFLPILEAARWTGVGRHCVWGNGEILTRVILDA